jgi:hypothetical protein
MRWLPERGLGVIALGNSTYAPMDKATLGALDVLHESGAIPPLVIEPSPGLRGAHDQLLTLLNDWSDEVARDVFAMNVSLDEDLTRRRQHMRTLRSKYGPFESLSFEPASATRASFTFHGPKGDVKGSLSLSPEPHPRIQTYEVTED